MTLRYQRGFAAHLRKGMIALAIGLGLTFVLSQAHAADTTGSLPVGSTTRSYTLHVPDGPAPKGGYPLLLAFHGGGMQGAGMQRLSGLDAVADRRGFIVAYPDGMDRHWNDGRSTIRHPQDDVAFTSALIDTLVAGHPVDRTRVFATGISNGALFVERLGCELSEKIAGIAPVAGSLPADIAAACHPTHPVAVLQIDGTADPIMPFQGGAVADFGGRGEGGQVLSVAATVAAWVAHDRCASMGMPQPMPVTAPADPTRALRADAARCPANGRVAAITVVGGGHAWPGGMQYARPLLIGRVSRQFDASETIADFFLRH